MNKLGLFGILLSIFLLVSCDKSGDTLPGVAPLYQGRSAESSMYVAISRNELDIVKQLASRPGFDVNASINERYGDGPLAIAAYYGRYEIAQFLIEKGADVNRISKGERRASADTPLLTAIWKKQNKVAILLLQYGTDPMLSSSPGRLPCTFAKTHKNFEIMPHLPNCN